MAKSAPVRALRVRSPILVPVLFFLSFFFALFFSPPLYRRFTVINNESTQIQGAAFCALSAPASACARHRRRVFMTLLGITAKIIYRGSSSFSPPSLPIPPPPRYVGSHSSSGALESRAEKGASKGVVRRVYRRRSPENASTAMQFEAARDQRAESIARARVVNSRINAARQLVNGRHASLKLDSRASVQSTAWIRSFPLLITGYPVSLIRTLPPFSCLFFFPHEGK